MITVEIDPRQIAEVEEALQAFPRQAARAAVRAVNKTLAWVGTHGSRAIARDNDVPLKALRQRRRVRIGKASPSQLRGVAWFGVVPIAASYVGALRQTRTGARVGKHAFEGGFIATMPTGHTGIFSRLGKTRLKIREERVDLDGASAALASLRAQVPARLRTTFIQEFHYEAIVKGQRR
jgi:hypothetical protein